jgi:dephospho-CoA kinase
LPSFRAIRLGITGKISSGKSTLSQILRESGIEVLEADAIAREVMQNDPAVRKALMQILGKEAYTDQGLNTDYVARTIFSSPKLKTELEAVVHTAVWQHLEDAFAKAKPGSIIGVESAIFYQTGYDALFDLIILVDASDDMVKANAARSGRFSPEEIEQRLKIQNFGQEWKEDADFVLVNDCPLEEFEQRCRKLSTLLRITAPSDLPRLPLRFGQVGSAPKRP